jgi:hypothetical protein
MATVSCLSSTRVAARVVSRRAPTTAAVPRSTPTAAALTTRSASLGTSKATQRPGQLRSHGFPLDVTTRSALAGSLSNGPAAGSSYACRGLATSTIWVCTCGSRDSCSLLRLRPGPHAARGTIGTGDPSAALSLLRSMPHLIEPLLYACVWCGHLRSANWISLCAQLL